MWCVSLCKSVYFVLYHLNWPIDCLLQVSYDFPLIAHEFLINTVKFAVDETARKEKTEC